MRLDLKGKAALVTGSSRGVGRAIAQRLIEEGCVVAMNARNLKNLENSAKELNCDIAISGDMSHPDGALRVVNTALADLGKLDILVCNVGGGNSVLAGTETYEEWQRVFSLNFWSATNTIEAARAALVKSRGNIVCISSICGLQVIPEAPLTYSVAKAALHAYVSGLARPLGSQNVRINAVALGNMLFEGSVWDQKIKTNSSQVQQLLEKDVSLRRLGIPKEAANLVAFLASSQAEFATGSVWRLDGGQV